MKIGLFIRQVIFSSFICSFSVNAQVSVATSDDSVTLDNGIIKLVLDSTGKASYLTTADKQQNLIAHLSGAKKDPNKHDSFYLDYYSHGVQAFTPDQFEIRQNTDHLAHIVYRQQSKDALSLEYHYIMMDNKSGIYSYVVAQNDTKDPLIISELRTVYRFDRNRLGNLYNGFISGHPYSYTELESFPLIQDETWKTTDGTVYTKYDFANYLRGSSFWGVYGSGYGVWLISAGNDYFSGDDNKQDLTVHQDAIILNYMTGAHLGTPDMIAPPGWSKMYGPWFIYINQGDDLEVVNDARQISLQEKNEWPYRWVNDSRYPQKRGSIMGRIGNIDKGVIILTSSDEEHDIQTLGYSYQATFVNNQDFLINQIRPGYYQVDIFAEGGNQPGVLYHGQIQIEADKTAKLNWDYQATDNPQWSIGYANRRASEFKFSGKDRNWRWMHEVAENLIYTIGSSDAQTDWYYAQTKPGKWRIVFYDKPNGKARILKIAFAAASNNGMIAPTSPALNVYLNDNKLKLIEYKNDKAIYRSAMQSGKYHFEEIKIEADNIKEGINQIDLENVGGAFMYDVITYSVPIESNERH